MSILKRYVISLILSCMLFVGFFVRIYHIQSNPAGFFCDEASIGYNAYTLLTTGKDEHGVSHPLFFQSFGDYRPPIPYYFAVPFIAIFGLSEWSVRLATATIGTSTILVLFFFLKRLFQLIDQKRYATLGGLVGAAILAISPWHIHFSRFGSEYIYLPFFILLSAWCFLEGIRHKKMLFVASILSICVCYTYLPGVLIGPLFFVCSLLIIAPYVQNKKYVLLEAAVVGAVVLIPVLIAWQNKTLQTRWNNVGLEKEKTLVVQIQRFSTQYIAHFSPIFLFTKGDIDYPGHFIARFGIRNQGQLYSIDGIFALLGIVICIVLAKKYPIILFPLLILFLYPIGSSITTTDGGGPLAFRSILGSIAFPIVTAIGITYTYMWIRKKPLQQLYITLLVVGYGILFGRYLYLYHTQYPLYSQNF